MLRRLLEWFFPFLRVQTLLARAVKHGRVTLAQANIDEYTVGWVCSIRPHNAIPGPKAHRYTWSESGSTLQEALSLTVAEAEENPVMITLDGISFAPKLGGKEFDDG